MRIFLCVFSFAYFPSTTAILAFPEHTLSGCTVDDRAGLWDQGVYLHCDTSWNPLFKFCGVVFGGPFSCITVGISHSRVRPQQMTTTLEQMHVGLTSLQGAMVTATWVSLPGCSELLKADLVQRRHRTMIHRPLLVV